MDSKLIVDETEWIDRMAYHVLALSRSFFDVGNKDMGWRLKNISEEILEHSRKIKEMVEGREIEL